MGRWSHSINIHITLLSNKYECFIVFSVVTKTHASTRIFVFQNCHIRCTLCQINMKKAKEKFAEQLKKGTLTKGDHYKMYYSITITGHWVSVTWFIDRLDWRKVTVYCLKNDTLLMFLSSFVETFHLTSYLFGKYFIRFWVQS